MADANNNTAIGSFAMSSTNNADAIDNVAIGAYQELVEVVL